MHGKGRFTDKICTYDGDFVKGLKHGEGKYTYQCGSSYVGSFVNNNMHGFGKYTYASGSTYVGHYENNEMHGQGKFTLHTGKIRHEGLWKNGEPIGK